MKDGRTHLAYKAEQVVDLDIGAVVSLGIQPSPIRVYRLAFRGLSAPTLPPSFRLADDALHSHLRQRAHAFPAVVTLVGNHPLHTRLRDARAIPHGVFPRHCQVGPK
jgi:hypothetical protein